ncbi:MULTISPECIES: YlqD family protein [unclassified Bacillus (in: firmicutes)]|uniref:YlqD family protein n=1 Tax=unclassified Bacillus (in: firmicutes) TaxID=185979 RepID=UPI0008E731B1|nr:MULTISPECIES: YlqD family protein [unclassified Bacillus (in: firmicutes)]SFA74380.1 YlqD protein [Bacillus sp. UNCCL13]SFQ64613.1 YlqD protein [Bacillus sp. cl95]
MKILQSVEVKQIVTEKSKQILLEKYGENKRKLSKEIEQLQFQWKKTDKTKQFNSMELKVKFEKEIHHRQEKLKLLDFQIEQLHMLPLGSELKEKEVQAVIDIKVGDHWEDSIGKTAIIIKDGKIEEIR